MYKAEIYIFKTKKNQMFSTLSYLNPEDDLMS